jgi:formamidopyrimidine-DNA glycosylase
VRTLSERLIGRSIRKVDVARPELGILIELSDEAGFTVYTSISVLLAANLAGSTIEGVSDAAKQLILHLNNGGCLAISTDVDAFEVVEAFVYRDEDGYVVHN